MSPLDYVIVDENGKYLKGTDSRSYPEYFFADLIEHFSSAENPRKTQYLETHLYDNGISENVLVLGRKLDGPNWCVSVLNHKDLQLSTTKLEEKHFNLKSMLSVFAHEFRNPLASLTFAADLLKDKSDETELIQIITQNARSMSNMLDDLHDYEGFRDGRYVLEKTHLALNKIILNSTKHFDNIFLDINSTENAVVNADGERISQVLGNIIKNSTKFKSSAPLEIKLQTELEGAHVLIRISDNGKGISAKEIEKIKLPFFQVKQDLSRKYGGLGLGLYISKTIIDLHNGEFEVSSAGENKGTVVTIKLPIAEKSQSLDSNSADDQHHQKDNEPELQGHAQSFQVLFVEDNPDLGHLLLAIFRKEKRITVSLASSSREAIELFKSNRYDLVVSDIGLPEMDGFELKKHLEGIDENDTKFIAMTGYSDGDLEESVEGSGFLKHLVKPVSGKKMIKEVKEVLGFDL